MHYSRKRNGRAMNNGVREYHGKSKTKEYNIWNLMISRCENKNNKNYPQYGGRGILVCDRWRNSFSSFLKDMGECPSDYTIERLDNDKGYEPQNCVWATRLTQANNQRARKDSKTGMRGIDWVKNRKRWRVRVFYKNKCYECGLYKGLFEAYCARKSKELEVKGNG